MTTKPELHIPLIRRRIYKLGGAALLVLFGSIVFDTHLFTLAFALRKATQIQFGTTELLVAGVAVLPMIAMLVLLLLMIRAGLALRAWKQA